jgi:hypothetical protein
MNILRPWGYFMIWFIHSAWRFWKYGYIQRHKRARLALWGIAFHSPTGLPITNWAAEKMWTSTRERMHESSLINSHWCTEIRLLTYATCIHHFRWHSLLLITTVNMTSRCLWCTCGTIKRRHHWRRRLTYSLSLDGYGQMDIKDSILWPNIVKHWEMIVTVRPHSLSCKLCGKQAILQACKIDSIYLDILSQQYSRTCSNSVVLKGRGATFGWWPNFVIPGRPEVSHYD